ncbi:protein kinase [Streptomyces sp. DSM 44915]|uniref:non-specific serine/threonine protein kinase n=1 Tax=Streptomyces chisholmiae TaxID=3075540 RepID=A0ABU2JTC8_9ACTN|nr:protein kinase [Streptomyces sp. DSM 44915]MDT0268248.1 protein kinase [Streptomyces sp. DSM 44915]
MVRRGTELGGRYHLVARIGGGAMGEVWRADDNVLGRHVAVKVLRPKLLDDPTFVARFRREARVLATLNHPNIVQVHDYGENQPADDDAEASVAYIVMELVEGQPLERLATEGARMAPARALGIAAEALDGLHAAHQQDIVHRDIKPSNLMLSTEDRVKVTDFGIARAVAGAKLTDSRTVLGTALYMAPEQAEGKGAVPASDLYSIGVICYQLLTGGLPFTGDSAVEILLKHIRRPVPALPDDLPEPVRAFVLRALAKEPDQRHASAAAMAAAARRAATGEPADDPPPAVVIAGPDASEAATEVAQTADPGDAEAPAAPVAEPAAVEPGTEPPGQDKQDEGAEEKAKDEGKRRRRVPLVVAMPMVVVVGVGSTLFAERLPWNPGGGGAPESAPSLPVPRDGETPEDEPTDPAEEEPTADEDPEDTEEDESATDRGTDDEETGDDPQENADVAGGGVANPGGGTNSGGDTGGSDGSSGGSSGDSSGGSSSSGGTPADPPDEPDEPDDPPANPGGPPRGCGGDNWGHLTSVGDGLRVGLVSDQPTDNTAVIMGGHTALGWVRSDAFGNDLSPCNEDHPILTTSFTNPDHLVIRGNLSGFWQLQSAGSGAHYVRDITGRCLTNNGAGEQLIMDTCISNNRYQQWHLPG